MLRIVVFGIGTRQGCKLFKVLPPHLILVARICLCIIIGRLDRVIDALRQVDWFHIKFKSIVRGLFFARFLFISIAWPSIYLPSSLPTIMETSTDKAKSTSPFTSVSIPPPSVRMVQAKTEDGNWRTVPLYKAGMDVCYRNDYEIQECKILTVHHDNLLESYYTVLDCWMGKKIRLRTLILCLGCRMERSVMKKVWLIRILQDNNVHNVLLFCKNKEWRKVNGQWKNTLGVPPTQEESPHFGV